MKKPSEPVDAREELRQSIIGLGERSIRKRYYPERQQRIAEPDQATSDLALPACRQALAAAGITETDIDYIIMGTITPDCCCPAGANVLQGKLGAHQAVTFDITAACSGFVFALDVAMRYLQAGAARNILVVAAEVMSRVVDWTDRATCVLWGDGAGAAVLKAEEGGPQIIDLYIGTDGANGQNLLVPGGGSSTTRSAMNRWTRSCTP